MPIQTLLIFLFGTVGVGLACVAVLKLNEKNMQDIEANQKEIDKLTSRINQLKQSQEADSDSRTESPGNE